LKISILFREVIMAVNKVATTCFTDIEDSAALTEQFGETVFGQLRSKYFAVCETLAHRNEATSVKNTGDGHMITFDDLVPPLNFAAQLQAFYHPNPNYIISPLKFRAGLFSGMIEQETSDAFGSGVNRAARVESKTPVGAVWVNEDIQKQLTIIWGDPKAKQLFGDQGNIDVKKLAPISMYSFNWQKYITQYPDNGLAALVLFHS
jgi:class 3 adenylate cyclase